jgi:hypothetical protein
MWCSDIGAADTRVPAPDNGAKIIPKMQTIGFRPKKRAILGQVGYFLRNYKLDYLFMMNFYSIKAYLKY